jgi:hypothetical protein
MNRAQAAHHKNKTMATKGDFLIFSPGAKAKKGSHREEMPVQTVFPLLTLVRGQ